MYTIESLKEINQLYDYSHGITLSDVDMANNYVEVIQLSRTDDRPQVGDIVEFTTRHGDYYRSAHIEAFDRYHEGLWDICEQPYTPFIWLTDDKNNIKCNTSGGAWSSMPNDVKLIGKRLKTFCDWGSCGACANGAVHFQAEVNVWEYKEHNPLYGDYTTKDWCRSYISYRADEFGKPKDGSNYTYLGDGLAFATREDYNVWAATYRANIFKGNNENQEVLFHYREKLHVVSKEEYLALILPVDTRMNNMHTVIVKFEYDDDNHIVNTYSYAGDVGDGAISGQTHKDLILDWFRYRPYEYKRNGMHWYDITSVDRKGSVG